MTDSLWRKRQEPERSMKVEGPLHVVCQCDQCKAQPEQEPVLVVEKEPDYMSRGHLYTGTKPHIDPTKVWSLPIGTKLYTAPPQPKEQEFVTLYKNIPTFYVRDVNGVYIEDNPLNYYTTKPQREFVGLTPQERDEINEQVYGAVPHHVAFHHAIEAKLKEKNT